MEKREKEVEEQRRKAQAERDEARGLATNGHLNGGSPATNGRHQVNGNSRAAVPTGPRAGRRGDVPTGPASAPRPPPTNGGYDRTSAVPSKPAANGAAARSSTEIKASTEQAAAAAQRQRYMGAETNTSTFSAQKKRKRTNERRFQFGWQESEDTSQDHNPIYQARQETTFFGRGRLGGFAEDNTDASVQKYAKALAEQDTEAGRERAMQLVDMERRRKEEGGRNALDKHWSEKRLDQMRERDWRIFKEDFQIATRMTQTNPMRSWSESGLPKRLLDIVDQVGYTEPSPVQRAAIPIALQARDLLGTAVTGSGKTAAFLLPLLVYISELPALDETNKNDGPYAIILAPTRELAQQIEVEAKKFATPLGFTCVSITGGHSIEEQSYNLRNGAEIVIATPGRLVDCIERRVLVLSQCCYIIMDEADRMVDMGFEEPVNKILDALPVSNEKPDTDAAENPTAMSQHLGGKDRYRQTMMYTATMPAAVERIAKKYLRRPAIVTIGNLGEAVETVEQRAENIVGEDKRNKRLQELLSQRDTYPPPVIVFVNIKRNCDVVARTVKHWGFAVQSLHGGKTQPQREAALAAVRAGEAEVLVATDLAGRGIDLQDVSLVVNYNLPSSIEAYQHRIGRTGRAGKSGVAVSFWGPEDKDVLYDLKQILTKSGISKVPEDLKKHEAAQQKPVKGGGGRKAEDGGGGGFGGKASSGW